MRKSSNISHIETPYYQVALCSEFAIRVLTPHFGGMVQHYRRLPGLEKSEEGVWTCELSQNSLKNHWVNLTCPQFQSWYCERVKSCLSSLEKRPWENYLDEDEPLSFFNGLVARTLGRWQTSSYRSFLCEDRVKDDFSNAVRHLLFRGTTRIERSRGRAYCIWYPRIVGVNLGLDMTDHYPEWLRTVHLQCDDLKECFRIVETNIQKRTCSNQTGGLSVFSDRVLLMYNADLSFFPFQQAFKEVRIFFPDIE